MKRLSRLTLVFAVLFAVFILLPPFLSPQFGPYPLMKVQDIFDLFTPLVLVPVYWLLFEIEPARRPSRAETILFLILAALWVEGQGMHLAANSVDNLLQGKGPPQAVEAIGTLGAALADSGVSALTYFYDEILSHYLWHAAAMGLAALLIYRQWKNPFAESPVGSRHPVIGGVLYGLTYVLMSLEGETLPLALPFAVLVTGFLLVWGRPKLPHGPIMAFFFTAFALASVLFLVWWLAWGCFAGPLDALHSVLQGTRPLCP